MKKPVYVNGRAIGCKAARGKSAVAFPDVCFTPPLTPPQPIGLPLPYPNTALAKQSKEGSKDVAVAGKEVVLRDKSFLDKNRGNEAAKTNKKGFVTSVIQGKAYFCSWSQDVRIEGKNAVRDKDITTHNHGSFPGQTPTWPYLDLANPSAASGPCGSMIEDRNNACKNVASTDICKNNARSKACRQASKCMLIPCGQRKKHCCRNAKDYSKKEQAHHLIEVHCFTVPGGRKSGSRLPGFKPYDEGQAPGVCAEGSRYNGEHGALHAAQQQLEAKWHKKNGSWTYAQARDTGAFAHCAVFPHCDVECIKLQLDNYHQQKPGLGATDSTVLRTDPHASTRSTGKLSPEQASALRALLRRASRTASRATPR